jgi:hypothetical protein
MLVFLDFLLLAALELPLVCRLELNFFSTVTAYLLLDIETVTSHNPSDLKQEKFDKYF